MIIKWYNRDSISDQDMIRAKLVADRLMGKKQSSSDEINLEKLQKFYKDTLYPSLLPYQLVVSPSQYEVLKKLEEA